MADLTGRQKEALIAALQPYFTLQADFERAILDLEKKAQTRVANRRNDFSLSTWIRGLAASQHLPPIRGCDQAADLRYFEARNAEVSKDISSTTTPGSYLVPTIQSDEIVALLSDYGTLRRAGVRVIPMVGLEKLTFPVALTAPTVEWLGENTAQSSSDLNVGQVSFNLKTARSLTPIPNELLASSVPAVDAILAEVMAIASAEAEDAAFFATTSTANAPGSLYADRANLTTLLAGGNSANGGALTYSDILAVMAAARNAKAKGPFVWLCNPTTLYQKISGLLDQNSRPIFDSNAIVQRLFGFNIYDTSHIAADQSNGSGSNQTFLVLAPPSAIMLGESGTVEIAVSSDYLFASNQLAVRSVRRIDWQWAQKKAITILKGIA